MIFVNQKYPDTSLLEWILWQIHWLELDDNNFSFKYCHAMDLWFIFANIRRYMANNWDWSIYNSLFFIRFTHYKVNYFTNKNEESGTKYFRWWCANQWTISDVYSTCQWNIDFIVRIKTIFHAELNQIHTISAIRWPIPDPYHTHISLIPDPYAAKTKPILDSYQTNSRPIPESDIMLHKFRICSMLANSIRIRDEEINYFWPLEMISHTILFNGYILVMAWLYSPVYIFWNSGHLSFMALEKSLILEETWDREF